MIDNLERRDWITRLWEETESDPQLRDLLFEGVIGGLEEDLEAEFEALDATRREEIRDEIREEWQDDPPDNIRMAIIKKLIEDPPATYDEAYGPWEELRKRLKDEIREDLGDEVGDLKLMIEQLQGEIKELKGARRK